MGKGQERERGYKENDGGQFRDASDRLILAEQKDKVGQGNVKVDVFHV